MTSKTQVFVTAVRQLYNFTKYGNLYCIWL